MLYPFFLTLSEGATLMQGQTPSEPVQDATKEGEIARPDEAGADFIVSSVLGGGDGENGPVEAWQPFVTVSSKPMEGATEQGEASADTWWTQIQWKPELPFYQQPILYLGLGAALLLTLLIVFIVKLCHRSRPAASPLSQTTVAMSDATGDAAHHLSLGNAQHIGSRENQQDSFGMSSLESPDELMRRGFLAVVADGMGGLSNGAQISNLVVSTMLKEFQSQDSSIEPAMRLLLLVQSAQKKVLSLLAAGTEIGGSTVVATLVQGNALYTISVGDSRIYLLRNQGLMQLTREHVYAAELDERASRSEMSYSLALHDTQRKALTAYIGMTELEKIDRTIRPTYLLPADKILLVSDGVFGSLSDLELTELLKTDAYHSALNIRDAVLAKRKLNQDNLTAVVLEYC